jgi:hypothetical protein
MRINMCVYGVTNKQNMMDWRYKQVYQSQVQ